MDSPARGDGDMAVDPGGQDADIDSLSAALASMHVAKLREHNRRLHSEAVSVSALVDALRTELCKSRAQAQELAQMQHQLSSMVPAAAAAVPDACAGGGAEAARGPRRQASSGDKRKQAESDDEMHIWRSEVSDEASESDDADALLAVVSAAPTPLDALYAVEVVCGGGGGGAEVLRGPASSEGLSTPPLVFEEAAEAEVAGSVSSVHEELRRELRVRARLEEELARHVDQRAALYARLQSNDLLIRRLESVNQSLLLELQQMRDACVRRDDLLAKRGRHGEDVECF